jgi:EpsI family protein
MTRPVLAVLVLGATLLAGSALPDWLRSSTEGEGFHEALLLHGCTAPDAWQSAWQPDVTGAAHAVSHSYRCGDARVHVFVAQFADQTEGAEAVSDGQSVVPYEWRSFVRGSSVTATGAFNVTQYDLERGLGELLIWSWYAIGEGTYTSDVRAKLVEVRDAMLLQPRPVAIIAVAVEPPDADLLRDVSAQVQNWYVRQGR